MHGLNYGEQIGSLNPFSLLNGAYLLKEAFQQLWDYNSATWAGKFLDEWCRQVMRSRIEPMKKIARSLREHRELILNYFRVQKLLSSGVVEGLNNKAKVTMRKILRFPHLPLPRTGALSLTWQIARARINPRFFLTNQSFRLSLSGGRDSTVLPCR